MKPTLLLVLLSLSCLSCAKKDFFATTPLADTTEATPGIPASDYVNVVPGKHYAHGRVFSLLFGKHYRELWSTPVQARVLHLNKEKGGMKIVEVGGSLQSTSFTLEDSKGYSYALRTVDKDPSKSLSPFLQKTIVSSFLRDQTAALNPYAALMVAPLARAAGIPHATPELVYVPADSAALGKYTKLAGDKLYMLEEKLEDKRVLQHDTANFSEIVSSKKLLKKRFEENNHQVDQLAFAKARLFDLYINDRDRHQGQWNWAKYKVAGKTIYKPIPKDRDQAFYRFADGLLPRVVGRGLNFQKFISFRSDLNDLEALMHKSDYIDEHFLSEVTQAQFDSLAEDLQLALTDSSIYAAALALPEAAFQQIGENTMLLLKSRRDYLPEAAKAYYKLLAREVTIVGTDEEEKFIIERLDDARTAVTMLDKKDKLLYYRVFHGEDTKEIILFGLGDDDIFEVKGSVAKGIKVTINGGLGEDEIKDTSNVKGWNKMTVVRDTKIGTNLKLSSETKDETTSDVAIHAFNREGH